MITKAVRLNQGRNSALFSCSEISHQDTKTRSYTKSFIKNKSLVPLCLGGNSYTHH